MSSEPKGNGNSKRVRFTIEIPVATGQKVEALAGELCITKAEVTRRAFAMLLTAADLKAQGYTVGAFRQTPEGRETVLLDNLVS